MLKCLKKKKNVRKLQNDKITNTEILDSIGENDFT